MEVLFNPSNANPPVIAPSPITATTCFLLTTDFCPLTTFSPTSIPSATDIELLACPHTHVSYSLSNGVGKGASPLNCLFV